METIYQTIVKDCGCDVGAFDKKNFLITFGHKTLVTLKDFCYFIDITHLKKKQETMVVPASFDHYGVSILMECSLAKLQNSLPGS